MVCYKVRLHRAGPERRQHNARKKLEKLMKKILQAVQKADPAL